MLPRLSTARCLAGRLPPTERTRSSPPRRRPSFRRHLQHWGQHPAVCRFRRPGRRRRRDRRPERGTRRQGRRGADGTGRRHGRRVSHRPERQHVRPVQPDAGELNSQPPNMPSTRDHPDTIGRGGPPVAGTRRATTCLAAPGGTGPAHEHCPGVTPKSDLPVHIRPARSRACTNVLEPHNSRHERR
jgi:hypothetical protein